METVRNNVKSLLESLGINQSDLVRKINAQRVYHVTPGEVSEALSGALTTPKANRIIADCYSLLTREEARREKQERAYESV